jgi:hypothetical protein
MIVLACKDVSSRLKAANKNLPQIKSVESRLNDYRYVGYSYEGCFKVSFDHQIQTNTFKEALVIAKKAGSRFLAIQNIDGVNNSSSNLVITHGNKNMSDMEPVKGCRVNIENRIFPFIGYDNTSAVFSIA